jgi:hypothetical protein
MRYPELDPLLFCLASSSLFALSLVLVSWKDIHDVKATQYVLIVSKKLAMASAPVITPFK